MIRLRPAAPTRQLARANPSACTEGLLGRLAAARFAQRSKLPDAASKPAFEIDLLGRPRVSYVPPSGNLKPVTWRLRRSFELVAYLALAPERWVTREAAVLALWPDAEPLTVERNFHPTISDARRALSQAAGRRVSTVVVDQGGYRLSEAVSWRVDVDRFSQYVETMTHLRQAQPSAALTAGRRAWRAYRGSLLAGSRQPWADTARETIERRYHRLLEAVASLAAAADRLEEAMDAYRTLLVDDPFAETIHLALMEIYARQRRPDLVRRQFMRLEDLLRELDVEPGETTRARYLALVSRDVKSGLTAR